MAHVGWDPDGHGLSRQFKDNELLDDSVKDMLISLGQNPQDFNKEDVKFIYEFLHEKGFNPEDVTLSNLKSNNGINEGYHLHSKFDFIYFFKIFYVEIRCMKCSQTMAIQRMEL